MIKHVERRKSYEIIFKKCVNPRCSHCVDKPVISTVAWGYLREHDFKFPNPVPSINHQGHYQTFLEVEQLNSEFVKTGNSFRCSTHVMISFVKYFI